MSNRATTRLTFRCTHKVGDDAVESRPLVVQLLATLTHALLASAQAAEVVGGQRHSVRVQLERQPANGLLACHNKFTHQVSVPLQSSDERVRRAGKRESYRVRCP